MALTFELPDGSTKDVIFNNGPVGLDFERRMPIVIKRIKDNSPGLAMGIGLGWKIIAIDGQDLQKYDFQTSFGLLRDASARLRPRE